MQNSRQIRHQLWVFRGLEGDIGQALEETQGEVTPDINALQAFADEQATDLLELLAHEHEESKGRVAFLKLQQAKLKAQLDSVQSHGDYCKRAIIELMGVRGEKRAEAGRYLVTITAPRARVEMDANVDGDCLPDDCVRFEPAKRTPDKTAIGRKLKADQSVPGCRLVKGDPGVTIR